MRVCTESSCAKVGEVDGLIVIFMLSFFRADLAMLSVLKDSSVRSYSPTDRSPGSMITSLELPYSMIDTKLWGFDPPWRRLITRVVPIVNSEYM